MTSNYYGMDINISEYMKLSERNKGRYLQYVKGYVKDNQNLPFMQPRDWRNLKLSYTVHSLDEISEELCLSPAIVKASFFSGMRKLKFIIMTNKKYRKLKEYLFKGASLHDGVYQTDNYFE